MLKKLILTSIIAATSVSAMATGTVEEQTWQFSSVHLNGDYNGNSLNLVSNGISLEVSGWASTAIGCQNSSFDTDPCVRDANLKQWNSGIGMENRDEAHHGITGQPHHAIDNIKNNGGSGDLDYEMVLLTFSEDVNLDSLDIGWTYCTRTWNQQCDSSDNGKDADLSILAYTDNTNSQNFFDSSTRWEDIVGNGTNGGWDLIQHAADVDAYSTLGLTSGDSIFSRYWLVGAYNNVFGGSMMSNRNDAFKLAGLTTITHSDTDTSTGVSAPATLGMFAGLMVFLLYRRKL